MLKGLDPILNADVLHALKSMGHGDDLIISDMNFPSDSIARETVYGKLLKLENVTAGRAAEAILSLLPLDSFVDHPALRMEIVDRPHDVPPVQQEVQDAIDKAEGRAWPMGSIERFAFYEAAKRPTASSRPASAGFTAVSCSRKAFCRRRPELRHLPINGHRLAYEWHGHFTNFARVVN